MRFSVTLFSASYYDGKNTNKAAVAHFTHDQKDWTNPNFFSFTADVFAFTGVTTEAHLLQIQKKYVLSSFRS